MLWVLALARSLAWALLLTGWVGLGAMAQRHSAGTLQAFGLMALWLLALGGFATLLGRVAWRAGLRRAALVGAGALTAAALVGASTRAPWASLVVAALGWAVLVALASSTVRACRLAQTRRPGSPVVPAAAGALWAWCLLGDIGDAALPQRLAAGVLLAAVALAALHPRTETGPARAGCRAGLFDCSLPTWSPGAWRDPSRWPAGLAGLVMLPMMCGLSPMTDWCRGGAFTASAMLGLHFGAMFLPALWLGTRRAVQRASTGAAGCALLLGAGALAFVLASGEPAWALVAVLQGSAWSLAWAMSLADKAPPAACLPSPLAGALLNALAVLGLGWAIARFGPAALGGLHVALGLAAWLAWSATRVHLAWRRRRQNAAFRRDATAV